MNVGNHGDEAGDAQHSGQEQTAEHAEPQNTSAGDERENEAENDVTSQGDDEHPTTDRSLADKIKEFFNIPDLPQDDDVADVTSVTSWHDVIEQSAEVDADDSGEKGLLNDIDSNTDLGKRIKNFFNIPKVKADAMEPGSGIKDGLVDDAEPSVDVKADMMTSAGTEQTYVTACEQQPPPPEKTFLDRVKQLFGSAPEEKQTEVAAGDADSRSLLH